MKRAFLLIVVPALLVALGFAQTPATSINTDQTNIKGCLGGSDGNYTVVQDNTGRIFKITTSSVDLKPHLGHDVTLIGHRASGVDPAAADNSFAVTELNLISEHCAAAAAATTATASTPSETATTPAAPATAPAATISTLPETAVTPAVTAAAPAATVTTPAETAVAPPAAAAPPAETVVTPPAAAAPPAETVVTPPAAATPPAETVVIPAAAATPPAETASTPARTSSENVSNTCCSHHYARRDCQHVLGDCHHTYCSRDYTRCDRQHVLGGCQHTCCSRHYTHCACQELVLMALDSVRRAGSRHWHDGSSHPQVAKTENLGADGRPKSFF